MTHTPGPWTAYTTAKNGQPKVARRGGRTLAAVGSWSGSPTFEEDLANARLIAAAPDLLQACKQLISLADDGAYIDLADIAATPISRKLRAAIAKAEGKDTQS